jgi:hypothetical protein
MQHHISFSQHGEQQFFLREIDPSEFRVVGNDGSGVID